MPGNRPHRYKYSLDLSGCCGNGQSVHILEGGSVICWELTFGLDLIHTLFDHIMLLYLCVSFRGDGN